MAEIGKDTMSAFAIINFILFIVVIGTSIAERINVPYPLVLVVAGLAVGFAPGIPDWHPPSNIVLDLFLPPILFASARLISLVDIQSYLAEIISLSGLLVIGSTLVIALVLHWVVPGMPFSSSLVLGAIISPTDAIAATSIMSRMNIQQHIIRRLEVESLFNDSISIVLYNMAVVFVFMDALSIKDTVFSTLLVSIGGIVVGLVFAFFTGIIIKEFLTESENELPIIMSIILAYVAYLFADRIGVSGVLATVTAGLYHKSTERAIRARTRLSEKSVWDTMIFFLNGLIFIVIGMQFPSFLRKVSSIPLSSLVFFSGVTIVTLVMLRFVWVALTAIFKQWLSSTPKKRENLFSWSEVTISSWSGMRGLVSLALAIALPEVLSTNIPLPYRNLIIFLTIITILFTVLVQGLTLPILVKLSKLERSDAITIKEANKVYRRLTTDSIAHMERIDKTEHEYSEEAKQLVNNYYKNRLSYFSIEYETADQLQGIGLEAEKLLTTILEYERNLLHTLRQNKQISEEVHMRILSKIDRDEVGFNSYH